MKLKSRSVMKYIHVYSMMFDKIWQEYLEFAYRSMI